MMMESTINKTRARFRGVPESLKMNNILNQVLHDTVYLSTLYNNQQNTVIDNYYNSILTLDSITQRVKTLQDKVEALQKLV
jgi:hypothetical protein